MSRMRRVDKHSKPLRRDAIRTHRLTPFLLRSCSIRQRLLLATAHRRSRLGDDDAAQAWTQ